MRDGAFALLERGNVYLKILWKMEHLFENIMENGAFALLEQMLYFP